MDTSAFSRRGTTTFSLSKKYGASGKDIWYTDRYTKGMTRMNYIVLDLEWNQAMSADSSVFKKLPIHLRGEIIEIGAVKLTPDMTAGEEFTIDVRPQFFRRIHYKVKKITGFDKERLAHGVPFPDALEQFHQWCGEDVTFLTWGSDDQGIMEQNIIIHDLDWDWISGWINLQTIYSMQTIGQTAQRSLSSAMEHFGIEQTRVAHDALGDAYNTALVCSKLDMEQGIRDYADIARILAQRKIEKQSRRDAEPQPIEHTSSEEFTSKADAFSDTIAHPSCPICQEKLAGTHWVSQSDGRYMNLFSCAEHGKFLARLKFKKSEAGLWQTSRLMYVANDAMESFYRTKAAQARRRGRRNRRKKTNPAK